MEILIHDFGFPDQRNLTLNLLKCFSSAIRTLVHVNLSSRLPFWGKCRTKSPWKVVWDHSRKIMLDVIKIFVSRILKHISISILPFNSNQWTKARQKNGWSKDTFASEGNNSRKTIQWTNVNVHISFFSFPPSSHFFFSAWIAERSKSFPFSDCFEETKNVRTFVTLVRFNQS